MSEKKIKPVKWRITKDPKACIACSGAFVAGNPIFRIGCVAIHARKSCVEQHKADDLELFGERHSNEAAPEMTWQEALIWCIRNPSQNVRDKDGYCHLVSINSGAPRLRSCKEARPFDPSGEPYSVDKRN